MPLFNYYLQTEKEQINLVQLLQASKEISDSTDADGVAYGDPIDSIRTRTQLRALRLILCNLVRYPNEPILYSRQHSKTIGHRFNPQQIGIKVIKTVVDELYDKGIVDKTDGDNAYDHREDNSPAKLSEFKSYEYGLLLAEKLGITPENIYMENPSHMILRQTKFEGGNVVEFPEDWYSLHIEQRMKEYCAFLNEHRIVCKATGEEYKDIVLVRKYRDRDGSGRLIWGGRSGGYWMSLSQKERDTITIGNKPTVEIDFNASILNVLHKFKHGSLFPEGYDAYEIEGVDRELIKILVNRCMLNTDNRGSSSARMLAMCEEGEPARMLMESKLSVGEMTTALEKKHENLSEFFYRGEDMKEHYSWLEQNLVFEIAHNASKYGVPSITVHDSFRVREEDKEIMDMVINGTGFDEIVLKESIL